MAVWSFLGQELWHCKCMTLETLVQSHWSMIATVSRCPNMLRCFCDSPCVINVFNHDATDMSRRFPDVCEFYIALLTKSCFHDASKLRFGWCIFEYILKQLLVTKVLGMRVGSILTFYGPEKIEKQAPYNKQKCISTYHHITSMSSIWYKRCDLSSQYGWYFHPSFSSWGWQRSMLHLQYYRILQ